MHNELDEDRKILPLFCKKWSAYRISVLQKKHEGGTIVYMTNVWWGGILPTHLGYSWRWISHLCTDHRKLNDSLHKTQFSSKSQLAPFYKTGAMFPGGKCYWLSINITNISKTVMWITRLVRLLSEHLNVPQLVVCIVFFCFVLFIY